MKKAMVVLCALILWVFSPALFAQAFSVDITLNTNPAPISSDLSGYIADLKAKQLEYTGIPLSFVGFNGLDVGDGTGNGIDECVAFSFTFSPFSSITLARLTLDLTKGWKPDTSDHLLFADNSSSSYPESSRKFYGNDRLGNRSPYLSYVITLDLLSLGTNIGFEGIRGFEDVSSILLDGDLDVVYHDDAFIHSARLQIEGTPVPEPATMLLLASGLAGLAGVRRKLRVR